MAGLEFYDCDGTLTVGGVSMNRPAWGIFGDEVGNGGLVSLWVFTDQRGDDRIVPGAAGVVPYRRRETATRHDLRLVVVGDVDENGAATPNAKEGLASNLDYLESNVVQPTNTGNGTRAATLTIPGLGARTADIHVLGLVQQVVHLGERQSLFIGTLQISIPAGRFT